MLKYITHLSKETLDGLSTHVGLMQLNPGSSCHGWSAVLNSSPAEIFQKENRNIFFIFSEYCFESCLKKKQKQAKLA